MSNTSCVKIDEIGDEDSIISIQDGWEYCWAETYIREFSKKSADWYKFDLQENIPNGSHFSHLWIRREVSSFKFLAPAILVVGSSCPRYFEFYQNDDLLYQSGIKTSDYESVNFQMRHHNIPLPTNMQRKFIYLSYEIDSEQAVRIEERFFIGNSIAINSEINFNSLTYNIIGGMMCFIGMIGFFVSLRRLRKRKIRGFAVSYMFFAYGFYVLLLSDNIRDYVGNPEFIHLWLKFAAMSFIVGFFVFRAKYIGKGHNNMMTKLWQLHLIAIPVFFTLEFLGVLPMRIFYLNAYYLVFLSITIVFAMVEGIGNIRKRNIDSIVLSFCGYVLFVCAIIDIVFLYSIDNLYMPIIHWGALFYLMGPTIVMYRQNEYMIKQLEVYSKELHVKSKELEESITTLEEINENLERTVSERTVILNEKNKTLGRLNISLIDSEATSRQLVDTLLEGIVIHRNGVIHEVNRHFASILGYESEHFIGRAFFEFVQPECRIEVVDYCDSPSDNSIEVDFEHSNGSRLTFEIASKPLTYKGMHVQVVALRNVTERRQAEEALRESEDRYVSIFSNSNLVMWLIDTQTGIISDVNPAACNFYGYTKKEFTKKHISDICQDTDIDTFRIRRKHLYLQERHRLASGEFRDVEMYMSKMKARGQVFALGIIHDVTERVRATNALKKAEEKFRHLYENAPVGIFQAAKQNFISVNPEAAKLLGYESPEDLVASKVRIDKNLLVNPKRMRQILAAIIGKGEIVDFEEECYKKDGSTIWLSLNARVVDIDGTRFVDGYTFDVSERKKALLDLKMAKEEAENANRAKSDFLANMSHEIRTPMNAVIGFTDILTTLITDKVQRTYLDSIRSGGKSLLTLINDILDLSKIEAGRMELQIEPVTLDSLFKEIKDIFSLKISSKNLDFLIDIDENVPQIVLIDEVRTRQILFNLIGNAVKFTHYGYIKLSVRVLNILEDRKHVNISIVVEDTGIGIPAEAHEKIFSAFLQKDNQTTKKYGGTGLGLTITRRLVDMMNGEIHLKSEVDVGSMFEIRLKNIEIAGNDAMPAPQNNVSFSEIIFESAKILIVDDILANRLLIKGLLHKSAVDFVEAENGKIALELARKLKPDLVLMDIRMPVMDGYMACELMKSEQELANIPVVALTASVFRSENSRMNTAKFDGYLQKPIEPNKLFAELAKYLTFSESNALPTENESNTVDSDFEHIEISDACQIVISEILNELLDNKWVEISKTSRLIDIKKFGQELLDIGNKFEIKLLSNYGEKIVFSANNFDVEKIEKLIKQFPEMVSRILA